MLAGHIVCVTDWAACCLDSCVLQRLAGVWQRLASSCIHSPAQHNSWAAQPRIQSHAATLGRRCGRMHQRQPATHTHTNPHQPIPAQPSDTGPASSHQKHLRAEPCVRWPTSLRPDPSAVSRRAVLSVHDAHTADAPPAFSVSALHSPHGDSSARPCCSTPAAAEARWTEGQPEARIALRPQPVHPRAWPPEGPAVPASVTGRARGQAANQPACEGRPFAPPTLALPPTRQLEARLAAL